MLGVGAVVALIAILCGVVVLRSAPGHAATGRSSRIAQHAANANTLSVATASQIARDWFVRRDLARYNNADATLRELESGVALGVDRAFTVRISCGCEAPRHRHTLDGVSVLVPRGQSRLFLAHFAVTSSQGLKAGYTVFFTRASSGTWTATLLALDGHDVTIRPPASAAPVVTADRDTLLSLANYLARWRESGHLPQTHTRWTGLAGDIGRRWAQAPQDRADPRTGVRRHYRVSVDPTTYSVRIEGGVLTCGVLEVDDVASSSRGPVYQDPQQRNWGAQLKPGVYPALEERFTGETCVISRTTGERDLVSLYGTVTSITPVGIRT